MAKITKDTIIGDILDIAPDPWNLLPFLWIKEKSGNSALFQGGSQATVAFSLSSNASTSTPCTMQACSTVSPREDGQPRQ